MTKYEIYTTLAKSLAKNVDPESSQTFTHKLPLYKKYKKHLHKEISRISVSKREKKKGVCQRTTVNFRTLKITFSCNL